MFFLVFARPLSVKTLKNFYDSPQTEVAHRIFCYPLPPSLLSPLGVYHREALHQYPEVLSALKIRPTKNVGKNRFFDFCFSPFLAPFGARGPELDFFSSPPCDSLPFGCGELDFGDFYLIFGRNCKTSFFGRFFNLKNKVERTSG